MTSKTNTHQKHAVYSAAFIIMLDSLSFGLVMPSLPDLLISLGCTSISDAAFFGGMLSAVFALMQFVFGPLIGNLSDRFGRRPIVLLSLTVLIIDYGIKGFTHSMAMLFFGRIICGIGLANYSTACAIVADISSPKEKTENFGLLGAALGLGFILGALLASLLSSVNSHAVFYGAAIIAIANVFFGFFFAKETLSGARRRRFDWSRANPFTALKTLTTTSTLSRMMLVFFLYEIAFNVYQATWAFFLKERFGWHAPSISLSLGVFGITTALMQSFAIRVLMRRLSEMKIATLALALNALVFLLYAYATESWMIFALLPLSALGTVFVPALQSILSGLVSDDSHGDLQGMLTSVRAVSITIGPPLMASVFSVFTTQDVVHFSGAAFILAMLISIVSTAIIIGGQYRILPSAWAKKTYKEFN